MKNKLDVHFSTRKKNDWGTPKAFFEKYNTKYGPFELDVCATKENTKCSTFYSPEDNTFTKAWTGKCWMNPEYSEPEAPCKRLCKKKVCLTRGHCTDVYRPGQIDFVRKAYDEAQKGNCSVCMLLPARTDTKLFHTYIWDKKTMKPHKWVKAIEFVEGRITFEGAQDPAPFPSMIAVFSS